MNNNLSEKKTWVTPTIEEAPVQITEGGFIKTSFEFFIFGEDKDDSRSPS